MPRPAKGARLYLNPVEKVWLIRDTGRKDQRTGCSEADLAGAEKCLAGYIAAKFKPITRERQPDRISIAEALVAYGTEHATHVADPQRIGYAMDALLGWWGDKTLASVRGQSCREYASARGAAPATIRRELGVLSAAINHWHREHGPLDSVPVVSMPDPPPVKERWLTRSDAARLLAGSLGWWRGSWCDLADRREHHRWRRSHFAINRHLARFILLGLYTGTRGGALLELQWVRNTAGGYVDLDRGVLYRLGDGKVQTNKRRPPVRLGRRLLVHLRRWHAIDQRQRERAVDELGGEAASYRHVIHFKGEPILKVRRAWSSARALAGLGDEVTPHILRHTRATWLMHARVDLWEAAGSLGMSVQMLERTYGHHHPDWQERAAEV